MSDTTFVILAVLSFAVLLGLLVAVLYEWGPWPERRGRPWPSCPSCMEGMNPVLAPKNKLCPYHMRRRVKADYVWEQARRRYGDRW